jgi:hypothetical protein
MQEKNESIGLKTVSDMFGKPARPLDTRDVAAGPIVGMIEDFCADRPCDIGPSYSRCARLLLVERFADIGV